LLGIVDCPTDERGFDRNAGLLADQIRHSGENGVEKVGYNSGPN